ncbi:MAG: Jag N-terminal domain-containing protein [Desulfovibrio sp.]|nr:Jag N-terminal domain-containing protein [Desulfovibrio sp.]
MEGYKDFEGKDLDGAIAEACEYFNAKREKLEIEIIQDAKTGIFGIVGFRKAKIRARRVRVRESVDTILGNAKKSMDIAVTEDEEKPSIRGEGRGRDNRGRHAERRQAPRKGADDAEAKTPAESSLSGEPLEKPSTESAAASPAAMSAGDPSEDAVRASAPVVESASCGVVPADESENPVRPARRRGEGRMAGRRRGPAALRTPAPGFREDTSAERGDMADEVPEGLPILPLEELDGEKLCALLESTVRELIRPVAGDDDDVAVTAEIANGRARVRIECHEDSGLLIGREGQTLVALQYLASRIVSHGMNAAVRVQLDAGEYRQRQDEKLRAMALGLAEKVRQSGRSFSTRPLSSYHRRIVHLALQEAEDIQTRSIGDGPMKRVIIMRRRTGKAAPKA